MLFSPSPFIHCWVSHFPFVSSFSYKTCGFAMVDYNWLTIFIYHFISRAFSHFLKTSFVGFFFFFFSFYMCHIQLSIYFSLQTFFLSFFSLKYSLLAVLELQLFLFSWCFSNCSLSVSYKNISPIIQVLLPYLVRNQLLGSYRSIKWAASLDDCLLLTLYIYVHCTIQGLFFSLALFLHVFSLKLLFLGEN